MGIIQSDNPGIRHRNQADTQEAESKQEDIKTIFQITAVVLIGIDGISQNAGRNADGEYKEQQTYGCGNQIRRTILRFG